MATRPGAFRSPIGIVKLCVQIGGDYVSLGNTRRFASAMFQWPSSPNGNQWVKGPIAFDTDQTKWIPEGAILAEAWGLRRLTETAQNGRVQLRQDALRCDWPAN